MYCFKEEGEKKNSNNHARCLASLIYCFSFSLSLSSPAHCMYLRLFQVVTAGSPNAFVFFLHICQKQRMSIDPSIHPSIHPSIVAARERERKREKERKKEKNPRSLGTAYQNHTLPTSFSFILSPSLFSSLGRTSKGDNAKNHSNKAKSK